MTDNQSSLDDLLVDEQEISEELLHNLLSDFIRIGNESGDLIPQGPFRQLPAKEKIIIVLLSQRARCELDFAETEWMTPTEISNQSGVKTGTIYPAVRELSNDNVIEDDGDGSYRIPSHSINLARDYIEGIE